LGTNEIDWPGQMRYSKVTRLAHHRRAPPPRSRMVPSRQQLLLARLVALVLAALLPAAVRTQPLQGPTQPLSFVTRSGTQLMIDGSAARFAGVNVYWLALDENVLIDGSKHNYPTHFRVDDVFETAVGMGAMAIRAHTVGVSTGDMSGGLAFEPTLANFSEGNGSSFASQHIDYAVYRASQTGVRLIVPLTDNYHYYVCGQPSSCFHFWNFSHLADTLLLIITRTQHGGKVDFVNWVDPEMEHAENCVLPLCVKEPAASLCPFYTDRRVIAAFKTYITRLLNHVNAYTGRALKDEPAIMGWEVR
jgi:hypothetical protein